jgi:hypothetical protein
MATTFSMNGLVLLEQTIAQMQGASPSMFVGGQSFPVSYSDGAIALAGGTTGTMTTAQLQARIKALHAAFDTLPL